ncbi:MAG TPA: PAS domain S-box protein [Phycisphaerae bacterium]|nr:PAS domain S-box protein [Phycisphaerae bacterium]HUU93378.1 PAS domain S-box protein [Phycisphaerae bacterium]
MNDSRRTKAQLLEELARLRSEIEETPRESRAEAQAIYDRMGDGILVADAETRRFVRANPAMCRMLGYSHDELLALSVDDIHPPEHLPRVLKQFADGALGRVPTVKDVPCLRKDGSVFYADVVGVPGPFEGRAWAVGIFRDATDRRQAEAALRESEARYRAVIEDQTEMITRFAPDGTVTFVNDALCRFFGKTRDELLGRVYTPHIHADDVRWVMERIASLTPQNPIETHENRDILPGGEVRWLQWTNRGIFDESGRLTEMQAVGHDITERRRTEEALRQSEANYHEIFNAVNDCLFVHDIQTGDVLDLNRRAAEVYGYQADEIGLLNAQFRRAAEPPYSYEDQVRWIRKAAQGGPQLFEWLAADHGGRRFWVEVSLKRASIGGRDCLLAVLRDIADRKRTEEALRRSEENYRLLFEQTIDGIVVVADGKIVRANEAFAAMHRMALVDVLGKSIIELIHPDERDICLERIGALIAGEPPSRTGWQYRVLRGDGTVGVVEVRSRRILWEGKPAVQAIGRDVTQRMQLEKELQQALKMEVVGQLAGGIAHDFNNLMTGILCHAGLLKTGAQSADEVREAAGLIEGAARRAAELTSQLLGFARGGKHQDIPVDLGATIETSVRLLSRSLDPRIRVRTEFRDAAVYTRGDPIQMEQVVLNLAMNAGDAMPDGGEMTFTTYGRDVSKEACGGRPRAAPGRYVVLEATDTGCGIPKEVLGRIFEPFFTTKPQGKGTGMGLAMVYGIVRNHGGWVEVVSEVGRGTTFQVFLPAAEPPAEGEVPLAATDLRAPPGVGRLLVVDDEEVVRDVVARMLRALGYDVVTAADGREAVAYYQQFGRDVSLVIIDMLMPGMDGRACFAALRQVNPDVKAILSTGWGTGTTVRDVLGDGMTGLVQKPFQASALAEAVRRALGGPADGAPDH